VIPLQLFLKKLLRTSLLSKVRRLNPDSVNYFSRTLSFMLCFKRQSGSSWFK